jgi:hypothetical protein
MNIQWPKALKRGGNLFMAYWSRHSLSSRIEALVLLRKRGVGVARGWTVAVGLQGSTAMVNIWDAAEAGDVGEVERLVGQDPGLLDARAGAGWTPLMSASVKGRVGVVRWLLDSGAAINAMSDGGITALLVACTFGHPPLVKMLVERGADPTVTNGGGATLMIIASSGGHFEIIRVLLGLPSDKVNINHRDDDGKTALWGACYHGHGGVVTALLEVGADPTIASNEGTTPMTVAKQQPQYPSISAEGRRECVAALKVSISLSLSLPQHTLFCSAWLRSGLLSVPGVVGRRRSGPTSCGRPGRWRMRLRASRRRPWWNRGREARASVGAWRQCRRS